MKSEKKKGSLFLKLELPQTQGTGDCCCCVKLNIQRHLSEGQECRGLKTPARAL